jgi:tropomyosin
MIALRSEADEAHEQVDELKAKVKTLEQENLSKEQEITSLNHRNQLLEEEVEKAESALKEAKDAASQSLQHDTQNEALQRRVQLLEEEAEENDKTLRETNEKYDYPLLLSKFGADSLRTQASPNRHQGWSLRAEGAGTRGPACQVGATLRGCDQGTQRRQEGTRRSRKPDGRHLSWFRTVKGAGYRGTPVGSKLHCLFCLCFHTVTVSVAFFPIPHARYSASIAIPLSFNVHYGVYHFLHFQFLWHDVKRLCSVKLPKNG